MSQTITAIEKELSRKTKPRYLDPYQVIRQTLGSSYILAELDGAQLARPIATFRIIPYIRRKALQDLIHPIDKSLDTTNPISPSDSESE